MTLQEQYIQVKEGKGNKNHFLKQARYLFPEFVNHYNNFNETVKILKGKNVLTENIANLGMVSSGGRKDWFNLFNESVKAIEKNTSKEVIDTQSHSYDYKDMKNIDNLYGQTFLNGFYTEMQDPKNKEKTPDEIKQIVAKNLGNDWNYYATKAQFGIKDIGYTKEAPGLGEPKEPKGKYKSSGYGDLPNKTEKPKANTKDTLSDKEAKTTMPKKVEEMPVAPQNSKGVKKMPTPGKPKTIKLQESVSKMEEGIGMFLDPVGYEKSELSDLDKIFTKKYEGNGVYTIYKNGEKVKTIEGEGNANAWMNDEMRKLKNNMNIQESKLRSVIRSLIKEELNMKEIEESGKEAEYQAKTKKIGEEIVKRKKKLKALTTLEEIESGSTNPKMVKSLKQEIKKLEGLKMKLDKKYSPKEEVIGEEENTEKPA